MAYVDWSDDLSVGSAEIDEQHQRLVGFINQLHEAMTLGQGSAVLGEIVHGLIAYTQVHFTAEERYFMGTGYPDADAHKREHRDFVSKVTDFERGFVEGRLMLTLDVMDFLSDWLVQHIKGSDKAYAGYLGEARSA